MKKVILLILCSLSLSCFSVKRNVPSVYSTIQAALNACNFGDTVYVQPGTYAEHIIWPNTDYLKLISAGDSSNTIIDATLNGRCITINPPANTIDSVIVIKGFKLSHGYSDTISFTGVAIYVSNTAKIKITDVAICKNKMNALNGAMSFYRGSICYFGSTSSLMNASIYSNTITCNNVTVYGGLISAADINYANNVIEKNELNIIGNFTSQGLILSFGPSTSNYLQSTKIIGNLINYSSATNNTLNGGLISISSSIPAGTWLRNLLIANNSFSISSNITVQGLLLYNYMNGMAATTVEHCTFADNNVSGSPTINSRSVFLYGYFTTSSTTCAFICKRTIDIINSILWNPSIPASQEVGFINNSSSLGGSTSLTATSSDINSYTAGINCINQNPQFISITDHHLMNSSPCINSGTTTTLSTDLDGNPRPNPIGSFPDMGCYESSNVTGINEVKSSSNSFLVYPNPNTGEFVLKSKYSSDNSYFELYNINGQLIEKREISEENTPINLKELSSGLYFLKVTNKEKGSEAIKIIKQ